MNDKYVEDSNDMANSYLDKQNSYNNTEQQKKLIAMSNEEFDAFMCKRFPKFFEQRNLPETETCMCWGFGIGQGWHPLFYELCERLEVLCVAYDLDLQFTQIKEKYGSGRFYYDLKVGPTDSVEKQAIAVDMVGDLVSEYENKSDNICAISGKYYRHKIAVNGWVYDVCFEEFEKMSAKYPERVEAVKTEIQKRILVDKVQKTLYDMPIEKLREMAKS